MSTTKGSSRATLTIRGIDVAVTFKDIKNLHISVHPPHGAVRVAAPRRLDEVRVRHAIAARLTWIREQQRQFREAERQSQREMVSGESHYVWGVRRRLRVIERPGRAHVELDHDRLLLYIPADAGPLADAGSVRDARERVLQQWQRAELRRAIPPLLATWEPVVGRRAVAWGIKRMKTKWGSCNRESGRIWLNLELAKKPPACLEYVVVHELAHLIERNHGERFTELMDRVLPDWRGRRAELNRAPLADEEWM